jgi:predicted alpha/beta-fold hydrolase
MDRLDALFAHLWTISPSLRASIRPPRGPRSKPWEATIEGDRGPVRLTGQWREEAGARAALLVLHGLGGSVDRPYCIEAARAASRRGWSCLRLAMRGADRRGEDFYHAGLYQDVAEVIRRPPLARYDAVLLLGYSLGGHVALRYACAAPDPRVRAIAAICSPLDLDRGAWHLDHRAWRIYRRHLLGGLLEMASAIDRKGGLPTPLERLRQVRSIREWDALTVAPRFGFSSAEDYYQRESAGPRLPTLRRPALYVGARFDPVVPAHTVSPGLRRASQLLEMRWLRQGGHTSFPSRVRFDQGRASSFEAQVLDWLATQFHA